MNRLELADRYLNDANVLYTHNTQYELMSICCFNHIKYLLLELSDRIGLNLVSVKNLTTLVKKCNLQDLNDYLSYFRLLQEIKDNQEPNEDYCEVLDYNLASIIMNKMYKVSSIIKNMLTVRGNNL